MAQVKTQGGGVWTEEDERAHTASDTANIRLCLGCGSYHSRPCVWGEATDGPVKYRVIAMTTGRVPSGQP